jgi:Domain of unknown function (DUF4062)
MRVTIPVFISSKQAELVVERDLLADQIRRLPPLEPVVAEEWAPQAKRVQEVMLDKVRAAPIYVGLFASVYSEPTELEYREAVKNPYREVLIYIKSGADRDARLEALVKAMRDDHVVTTYRDVRDLLHRFAEHLQEAMSRMILQLQRLGEQPPTGRGRESRLRARWEEQQRLLHEFAFAQLDAAGRAAVIKELTHSRTEIAS